MSQDSLFGGPTPGDNAASLPGKNLFATHAGSPLAARMRPQSLDEVVGQDHLLAPGKPLRRLVEGSGEASCLLYTSDAADEVRRV